VEFVANGFIVARPDYSVCLEAAGFSLPIRTATRCARDGDRGSLFDKRRGA
jgi:hypothetical protein